MKIPKTKAAHRAAFVFGIFINLETRRKIRNQLWRGFAAPQKIGSLLNRKNL
jgi:hypothetical protein